MRNLTFVLSLISGLSFFSQPAFGALLSLHENGTLLADPINQFVKNGDVLSVTDDASGVLLAEEEIFDSPADIDALALLPDGRYVLSIAAGPVGSIGGFVFTEADLVAYDPSNGTAEMFLAGATLGTDMDGFPLDVDAVHVYDDGSMLLSFRQPGLVGGELVKDGDVYQYDPATGIGSIFLGEETDLFDPGPEVDVSAISVMDGKLLLGTREGATFSNGLVSPPSQISLYDPATTVASVYLSLEGRMAPDQPAEVDAVAYVTECDDGIDNDGDGLFDAAEDPGCAGMASADQETDFTDIPACGLGFELAFLLLPLMGWRKRSV